MTEEEARGWIVDRHGEAAAARVSVFLERVVAENGGQNLISPASTTSIWARHAVDSAQLLDIAPHTWASWLDIGTGGGFPGMVVALLAQERAITMVEPRAKRAAFLQSCIADFELDQAVVHLARVEVVSTIADVISARAVGPSEQLLASAAHCATEHTTWLLPRGRSGGTPPTMPTMVFHVKHSITDEASVIHVGEGRPR